MEAHPRRKRRGKMVGAAAHKWRVMQMAEQGKTKTRKKKEPEEERDRLEDLMDTYEDIKESFKSLLPSEFFEHISNAGKENLLALRSLIDSALDKIDREIERTERKKTSD
jgi:gas vesicle protein